MNADLVFNLEKSLIIPTDNNYQNRGNFKFVVDGKSLDWYNARLSMYFKLTRINGTAIELTDRNGIVNGASSFIKKISFIVNGKEVYRRNYANHVVIIKNLLNYDSSYAETIASNEFFYLDTTIHPNRNEFIGRNVQHLRNDAGNDWAVGSILYRKNILFNKGYFDRKILLGQSNIVNCEIPLNRYSFFEVLKDKILPYSNFELNIEFESDNNIIWRSGAQVCRIIITKLQLYIPQSTMITKMSPKSYLNEYVTNSTDLRQREGHFRITNDISKPHHVFIFIVNSANINSQTANQFLYQTFNVEIEN